MELLDNHRSPKSSPIHRHSLELPVIAAKPKNQHSECCGTFWGTFGEHPFQALG
jgi:hypothetical protein